MHNFIKHFVRQQDGAWMCTSPATLETVKGRVQVSPDTRFTAGTLFNGIDLVGMLDDEYLRQRRNGHASPDTEHDQLMEDLVRKRELLMQSFALCDSAERQALIEQAITACEGEILKRLSLNEESERLNGVGSASS